MPTAAKLVAALCFACVGWLGTNAFIPVLGDGATVGFLREIAAAIGAVTGWLVMGPRVGRGYFAAIGSGWVTTVVFVFFALLIHSTYLMLMQSTKMIYDGPMEAFLGIFDYMMKNGRLMLVPPVGGLLAIIGAISGMLTEAAGRRWR